MEAGDITLRTIDDYVARGIPPGDFVRALLANDLREALLRADAFNRHRLPDLVAYVDDHVPTSLRGSYEAAAAWIEERRLERRAATERSRRAREELDLAALASTGFEVEGVGPVLDVADFPLATDAQLQAADGALARAIMPAVPAASWLSFQAEIAGDHARITIWAGPEGSRSRCGQLVLRREEWAALRRQLSLVPTIVCQDDEEEQP